ncbi:hypothetical protein HDU67_002068, partial [Dinochytrium kinnereticum]
MAQSETDTLAPKRGRTPGKRNRVTEASHNGGVSLDKGTSALTGTVIEEHPRKRGRPRKSTTISQAKDPSKSRLTSCVNHSFPQLSNRVDFDATLSQASISNSEAIKSGRADGAYPVVWKAYMQWLERENPERLFAYQNPPFYDDKTPLDL